MRRFGRTILMLGLFISMLPLARAFMQPPTSAAAETPLYHDSRNLLYRSPFGAVPIGTRITLRLRSNANTLDAAIIRVFNEDTQEQQYYAMSKGVTTPDGFDFWEYKLTTPNKPTVLQYRFIVRKGNTVAYYEDDTKDDQGNYDLSKKGGPGMPLADSRDQSWSVTVYTPDFSTPQWMHDAVIYQIFPDRFRNGDKSNDPKDGQETFYGNLPLTFHKTWNEMMVDFKSDPTKNPNSDFFGGDLKGIEEKLPYLKDLGVTVIYLNPIFEARSNHRYDTVDYKKIDPILGSMDDWNALVKAADQQGIKIILDGVFNHVSSDSAYFDRYRRYPDQLGACENLKSPYRNWFFFRPPTGPEKQAGAATACVDDGKGNTYYESWAGFDSIPKLNNANDQVRQFIYGASDSVARFWLQHGASGWRLDVANEIDDGTSANPYWEGFRQAVKDTKADAVIISEIWNDVSLYVTGTQMDSTMNYRLMFAGILSFAAPKAAMDDNIPVKPIKPSDFDNVIMSELEDYPPPSMQAMMNLLGSHDTSRLSYVMGDAQSQELAAFMSFVMPGAPTIYYGDEIALKAPDLNGAADPYNRAPYPWPDTTGNYYPPPDQAMLSYYKGLAAMRAQSPALRDGTYQTLLTDDKNGVYVFLRASRPKDGKGDVALVVANQSSSDQSFIVDAPVCLADSVSLNSVVGATGSLSVKGGQISGTAKARAGAVYTAPIGCDLSAAPYLQSEQKTNMLATTAGDGKVTLTLTTDNTAYTIYRSYFPDGGFSKITDKPVTVATYDDTTVVNGYRYYYYVVGGAQSGVVMAAPGGALKAVTLQSASGTNPISVPLSVHGVAVVASVVSDTIDSAKPQHLIAQLSLSTPTVDPKVITNWQTVDAAADGSYSAILKPAQADDYVAVARFSADAGVNWTYSTPLAITITAPSSTTAPGVPANVKVGDIGMFQANLSWDAVPGAYGYRIYKGGATNRVIIGETTKTNFRDYDVFEGNDYQYSVSAIDVSLNESSTSAIVIASATKKASTVTFSVTVPASTPANDPVYIAGDFGTKDYPTWNPSALKMTDKGNNTWEITLNLPVGGSPQYKYVRGTWNAVEKGKDCEEITNRSTLVKAGANTVNDVVQKWRDTDKCP